MSFSLSVKYEDETFELIREDFPDIGISIRLPEFLRDLSEEEAEKFYEDFASSDGIAKADFERKIGFSFGLFEPSELDKDLTAEQIDGLLCHYEKGFSQTEPGYEELGMKARELDGHPLACLSFKSSSPLHELYNNFFLLAHSKSVVMGMFTCLFEEKALWDFVFLMCLDTIQFLSVDTDRENYERSEGQQKG
jgi:hypothetical protein